MATDIPRRERLRAWMGLRIFLWTYDPSYRQKTFWAASGAVVAVFGCIGISFGNLVAIGGSIATLAGVAVSILSVARAHSQLNEILPRDKGWEFRPVATKTLSDEQGEFAIHELGPAEQEAHLGFTRHFDHEKCGECAFSSEQFDNYISMTSSLPFRIGRDLRGTFLSGDPRIRRDQLAYLVARVSDQREPQTIKNAPSPRNLRSRSAQSRSTRLTISTDC